MTTLDPYLNGEPYDDTENSLAAVLTAAHKHSANDTTHADREHCEAEFILSSRWMNDKNREVQEQTFSDTKKRIIQMIEERSVSILDTDQLVLIEDIIEKINEHQL